MPGSKRLADQTTFTFHRRPAIVRLESDPCQSRPPSPLLHPNSRTRINQSSNRPASSGSPLFPAASLGLSETWLSHDSLVRLPLRMRFVAYRIPNLLRELFCGGLHVRRVYSRLHRISHPQVEAGRVELASAAFTTLLTIVTGITLIGILGSAGIVWLLAPGFHDDPTRLEMTTMLTRIMFPISFLSAWRLWPWACHLLRAFAAPAFSPVFFNLFIIGCAVFLAPTMSEPIIGVAIGVVAGGAAQFPSCSCRDSSRVGCCSSA